MSRSGRIGRIFISDMMLQLLAGPLGLGLGGRIVVTQTMRLSRTTRSTAIAAVRSQ
jgi:hypothetical protein